LGQDAIQQQIENGLNSADDKITLGLGGSASVEGGKVAAKGQVEITRTTDTPPKYTVAVGGEVAGGLAGELGAKLGGQATLDGEALLRAGGKIEMAFDSPEEAARASQILARQAAVTGAGQLPGPGGFIAGGAADALIGPSAADQAFLADHLSAVELKGGVAAEAAGALGVQLDDTLKVGGVGAKVNVSEDIGLRLELPQRDANGNVTRGARVQLNHEIAGGLSASAGLGVGDPSTSSGGKLGVGSGFNGQGKVTISQTFELPTSVTGENLLNDPVGTLRDTAQNTREIDNSVSLQLKGGAGIAGTTSGGELNLKLGVNPDQLRQSDMVGKLFSGDMQGALQSLGDNTTMEWKADAIATAGVHLTPEISVMGFGVGLDAQATLEDHIRLGQGQSTASQLPQLLDTVFTP